jgi:hypothetical protein
MRKRPLMAGFRFLNGLPEDLSAFMFVLRSGEITAVLAGHG